ncbi:hypothetical protein AB4458_25980 [Vibrio sp. 10N.261.45.F1]|uniref:hypothetical protein n=1 Tax=unclassified Vibrio TaxID=2614977 RepID=UPI003553EC93
MKVNKLALCAVVSGVLSGCAAPQYEGQGEYFELANLNLVERDLSLIKPLSLDDTSRVSPNAKAKRKKVNPPLATYTVNLGESYEVAIRRWLKQDGYRFVAWSVSDEHQELLSEHPKRQVFTGNLKKVWSDVSEHIDVPLKLVTATHKGERVAGVYDFEAKPRITRVSGDSLREVTKNVVRNYEMKWVEGVSDKRSWLAPNDYRFSADYFLITPLHDIGSALSQVLEGYPVTASVLESTDQVFIEEGM